jgi:hypothetical protein
MKHTLSIGKLAFVLAVFVFFITQNVLSQDLSKKKLSKIDQPIQAGFESLTARKWSEAATKFEEAQRILDKEKEPSEILFTIISIPDEDNSVSPKTSQEKQILYYRHNMATRQALLQFLSFTYQLNGDSAQAQKYHDAVYALQGPLWGLSWRVFITPFYQVFNKLVETEKGENFGRYQYLAGVLLADAGEGMAFDVFQIAQQNSPKDADIAGFLANGFLQKRNPKEAKRQAEMSLSIKPDKTSVLIDLAIAEWLLEDFDNSIKHAEAAVKIDAEAPGPHVTLALSYIEKNDFPRALKEAEIGTELSRRHPFYLTVQAAALEVSGNGKEAEKLLREGWKQNLPTYEDLNKWYINEKLRQTVLKIVKRITAPEIRT